MSTAPVELTALPMATKSGGNPNIDTQYENYHIDVVWTWPIGDDWTRFRLVRKPRSPATRVEEGRRVMETTIANWTQYLSDGRPWFRDYGPVPDEWNFYSAFVLNANRIWTLVGTMTDIGIGDHGWTTRLPESMPGAAVASDRGTMHPGDQGNTLVNFMQPMGVFMDRLVSMAEGTRMFLDPRRCAPRMLQFLIDTYGYRYTGALAMSRMRDVGYSVRQADQGMIGSIQRFAAAATGSQATVFISDNLFLNVNDSSFEMGPSNIYDCGWNPIANVEVIAYQSGDVGLLPPNVHRKYYAKIKAGTITCSMSIDHTQVPSATAPYRVYAPASAGIPMQGWEVVRMSCYAMRPAAVAAPIEIQMGIEMYDLNGTFIHSMLVYKNTNAGSNTLWNKYEMGDGANTVTAEPVKDIYIPPLQVLPSDRLTNTVNWKSGTYLYAPQTTAPTVSSGVVLTWTQAPTVDLGQAFWGISTPVLPGSKYTVDMTVVTTANSPAWRPAIGNKAFGDTVPRGAATTTVTFDWVADGQTALVGIEALRPPAGWSGVATSKVTAITLTRKTAEPAYAVPWLYVSKDCNVDLLVIDDGRGNH